MASVSVTKDQTINPGDTIGIGAKGMGEHVHWARFKPDPYNSKQEARRVSDWSAINPRSDIPPGTCK
jgi:hypothetical protein